MTQIELLPCPFCGSPCHMRESDGGVIPECYSGCFSMSTWYETTERAARDWNRRTASPTRSDTREQAAASPSAVGEASKVKITVARLRGITKHLRECPAYSNLAGDADWIDEAADFIQSMLVQQYSEPLSSQAPKPDEHDSRAVETLKELGYYWDWNKSRWRRHDERAPKPASAGGEPKLTAPAKVGNTIFGTDVRARLVVACAQRAYEAWAAEADTTKPDQYAPLTDEELDAIEDARDEEIIFPAADRLAPIEARGVVMDAMVDAALDALGYSKASHGSFMSNREPMKLAIEAALRARETAPAVEPSEDFEALRENVNQAMSGVNDDLVAAWQKIETWMESKLKQTGICHCPCHNDPLYCHSCNDCDCHKDQK